MNIKKRLTGLLNNSNFGKEVLFQVKKIFGRVPIPDMEFPELISLEIASSCNLSCIHCPPHMKKFKDEVRKFGIMKMELFEKLMDEIDANGIRRVALHKDGEPLLHPNIHQVLERVKRNKEHIVYLTTNAHPLKESVSETILSNKIDIVNFSIGAATEEFYSKVRGKNFKKVLNNIEHFLTLRIESTWKPKVIVQIIDLPNFTEMKDEINKFKDYWSKYDVEIQVWKQLTWGVFEDNEKISKRYPCYSLWESIVINSDGLVSVCCMDWQQKLLTGDANFNSIKEIWQSTEQQKIRRMHIENRENELPICSTCNYWSWQQKLAHYPIYQS